MHLLFLIESIKGTKFWEKRKIVEVNFFLKYSPFEGGQGDVIPPLKGVRGMLFPL
jgi:hypothetical protein